MTIAFDVDGTLVTYNDKPRWDIIELLKILSKYNTVIVWSGGGKDYAEMWTRKLFLDEFVSSCHTKPIGLEGIKKNFFYDGKEKPLSKNEVDICFDDELVNLAKVNIKV